MKNRYWIVTVSERVNNEWVVTARLIVLAGEGQAACELVQKTTDCVKPGDFLEADDLFDMLDGNGMYDIGRAHTPSVQYV